MAYKILLIALLFTLDVAIAEPLQLATAQQESKKLLGYYQSQAYQGDAHAQFKVGFAYEVGDGLPQDEGRALAWYEKAASQGHKNAIMNLAAIDKADQPYLDSEMAYQTELMSQAQSGDIDARNQLGKMLINNVLYEPDRQQIFQWVKETALAKERESQYVLAQMFEMGVSVPQNYIQAYAWYSIAAAAGDDRARFNRDALAERMSVKQLELGQEESLNLFEKMS